MIIVKHFHTVSMWLTLCALLLAPCVGVAHATPASARSFSLTPAEKMSPDLREALRTAPDRAHLRVIVQFKDSEPPPPVSLLPDVGGVA
ncbi:MAG TPA: hypothetical protein VD835_16935, partial [Pyrinomonadaceae bacterium]|nr:hypothetical protein [Pyrinomonadaceae bacterium]